MPKLYSSLKEIGSDFICSNCGLEIQEGIHSKDEAGNRFCERCKPIKTTPSNGWFKNFKAKNLKSITRMKEYVKKESEE
ncbi:MAG: hypothetical protein ACW98X_17785 [Promethearchaeota archaeon]|jgi:hypothetical protein